MRYSSSITRRKRRGKTKYVAVLSYYDQNGQRCQTVRCLPKSPRAQQDKGWWKRHVGTVNRQMNTQRAMLNEVKINDWITVNSFSKIRPGELISTADEEPRETMAEALIWGK